MGRRPDDMARAAVLPCSRRRHGAADDDGDFVRAAPVVVEVDQQVGHAVQDVPAHDPRYLVIGDHTAEAVGAEEEGVAVGAVDAGRR